MRKFTGVVMFLMALFTVAGCPAQQDVVAAKGIFVEGTKPSVKFDIMLNRDGKESTVPSTFRFQSGDKMRLRFEVNKPSYVYVLNRSVDGSSDAATEGKGIEVEHGNKSKDSYHLLFPSPKGGTANLLSSKKTQVVPGNDNYFVMDNHPGTERLIVLVSSHKLDITKYFNTDGVVRGQPSDGGDAGSGSGAGSGGGHNDQDNDVLVQLRKDLAGYGSNATMATPKGIAVDGPSDGYGVAQDDKKPFLVQLDLKHYSSN